MLMTRACPYCDGGGTWLFVQLPPGTTHQGGCIAGQCTAETRKGRRCLNVFWLGRGDPPVMTCSLHADQAGFGWADLPGFWVGPKAFDPGDGMWRDVDNHIPAGDVVDLVR